MLSLLLSLSSPAEAAEVEWQGSYRTRALAYSSLSLSNSNANALGPSIYLDHRLRLRPTFHVNSNVAVHAQIDALNMTPFGDRINAYTDPVTGEPIPAAFAHGVGEAMGTNNMGQLGNISLTRAWGDVYTPYGRLSFGRMPLDWGVGIMFNDGLGATQEFGDTSDRIQFTTRVGPVYVMAAYDQLEEGFWETRDDGIAGDLAVAYLGETLGVGLYNRYRHQFDPQFQAYNGSLWGYAELGPVLVETEIVGQFGSGDLDEDNNDVTVLAWGGVLRGSVEFDKVYGGLELGAAAGDGTEDSSFRTYTFDRDHNIALLMFEEPMPLLAPPVTTETNQGRDYGATLTGEGVTNALYFKPTIGYKVLPELRGDLTLIGARTYMIPDSLGDRNGYGWEVDASIAWTPVERFTAQGTFGVMLPGTYYSNFEDEELGGGFDTPVYGGRLLLTADF